MEAEFDMRQTPSGDVSLAPQRLIIWFHSDSNLLIQLHASFVLCTALREVYANYLVKDA
jgi:hypothetical protein